MLKLGKVRTTTEKPPTAIHISQFDMEKLAWSAPKLEYFEIDETEIGRGSLRSAYKAISQSPSFEEKEYVVKFYLPQTLDIIKQLNDTVEEHA